MNESLLLGRQVTFSFTPNETKEGTIVDKVDMKEKKENVETITGYMIEGQDGKLYNAIAYWRIKDFVRV